MPNHVENKLTIQSENLSEILGFIKSDERLIDFEKILPMPLSLHHEPSEDVVEYAKYVFDPVASARSKWYFDLLSERGQALKYFSEQKWVQFVKCLNNLKETGYASWYDWSVEKWGTKWNAYGFPKSLDTSLGFVCFQTAWSAPIPVISALSSIYPNARFSLEYADEDLGRNLGIVLFVAGEIVDKVQFDSYSPAAWAFAYKMHNPNWTIDSVKEDLSEYGYEGKEALEILAAL